jgi:hypothetical protein
MPDLLANLTWVTSGTFTAPLWGGLAAIAGVFFGTALLLFWIWMLADAYRRKLKLLFKTIWLLGIFLTIFGALAYFLVFTPKINRKSMWFKVAVIIEVIACLPTIFLVVSLAVHG